MFLTRDIGEVIVAYLRERLLHSSCMLDAGEDEFWTDDTEQTPWKYEGHFCAAGHFGMTLKLELTPTSSGTIGEDELVVWWTFSGWAGQLGQRTQYSLAECDAFLTDVTVALGDALSLTPARLVQYWSNITLEFQPSLGISGYLAPGHVGLTSVNVPGCTSLDVQIEADEALTSETVQQMDDLVRRLCLFYESFRRLLEQHFGGGIHPTLEPDEAEMRQAVNDPGVLFANPGLSMPKEHDVSVAAHRLYWKGRNDAWAGQPDALQDGDKTSSWADWYGDAAVAAYRAGYCDPLQYPCLACRQRSLREGDFNDGVAQCPVCHQWSALLCHVEWDAIVQPNPALSRTDLRYLTTHLLHGGELTNPPPVPSLLKVFAMAYNQPVEDLVTMMDYDYAVVPTSGEKRFEKLVSVWLRDQMLSTREVAQILGVSVGWVSAQAKTGHLPHAVRAEPSRSRYKQGWWRIPLQDARRLLFRKHPEFTPPPETTSETTIALHKILSKKEDEWVPSD